MANYYSKTRTNYFKVTDENALIDLFNQVQACEDEVHLDAEESADKTRYFMFWCEGTIEGIPDSDDEDCDYDFDEFIHRLQKLLPDDEAVIITEVGSEKMRYLVGQIVIVTNKDVQYRNLDSLGKQIAREMLNNPDWNTKNEY